MDNNHENNDSEINVWYFPVSIFMLTLGAFALQIIGWITYINFYKTALFVPHDPTPGVFATPVFLFIGMLALTAIVFMSLFIIGGIVSIRLILKYVQKQI